MTRPLVSVVLPVRNGERYVAQAIESVLVQRHRPLELLVVDGHSHDATPDIVAAYPEARLLAQPGTGIPDAWNHGIRSARGELIAFVSHDDRWTSEKLALQMAALDAHPEALYCVGRFEYFLESGSAPAPGFRSDLLEGDHLGRVMETLVARREAFEVVGMMAEELTLAHDVDWFARAKDLDVPMEIVDAVVLEKRVHGGNSSTAPATTSPELLDALRRSIERQRADD